MTYELNYVPNAKKLWNERYARKEFVYGKQPNAFLKKYLENECPQTILFPSEGEGRNAVYAAKMGWEVHAVDFSETASQKAQNWALENKVQINYQVADLAEWDTDLKFDCIALIYAHYIPELRTRLHRKFVSLLKPGGTIILESFSKKQTEYDTGGPGNPEMLYDIDTLKQDFSELKIDFLQERVINLEEGEFHNGDASVMRMIAKKPLSE